MGRHYEVEIVSYKVDGTRVTKRGLLTDNLDQARRRALNLWRLGVYSGIKVVELEWADVDLVREREVVVKWGHTEEELPQAAE